MRVLMLHNRYLERGGEDSVFQVEVELLRSMGWEVSTYEENNERVAQLGAIKTAFRSIWSLESYRRIRGLLREKRCDILHVHNFFPLISPSAYYAARAEGVPVVQTLHNYRLLCPPGTFSRAGRVCEDCLGKFIPWPGIRHGCYRDSVSATAAVAAMVSVNRAIGTWSRMVNVYIALTSLARGKFIEGGIPAEKIVVKPNFVSPDPGLGTRDGGYALFVGRLSAEKGVRTLLSAWRAVGGRMPLKIVGVGPLADEVAEMAAQISGLEYLGWQSPDQVMEIMGKAEFLVFPSEWYEGQPRVVIEALSRGLPVIGSRIGAMEEIVQNGNCGLLFEPGDARSLTEKILWALDNQEQLSAIGLQGRAEFEKEFTAEANFSKFVEIYEAATMRSHALRTARA